MLTLNVQAANSEDFIDRYNDLFKHIQLDAQENITSVHAFVLAAFFVLIGAKGAAHIQNYIIIFYDHLAHLIDESAVLRHGQA